jgi:hypothetical protein
MLNVVKGSERNMSVLQEIDHSVVDCNNFYASRCFVRIQKLLPVISEIQKFAE